MRTTKDPYQTGFSKHTVSALDRMSLDSFYTLQDGTSATLRQFLRQGDAKGALYWLGVTDCLRAYEHGVASPLFTDVEYGQTA